MFELFNKHLSPNILIFIFDEYQIIIKSHYQIISITLIKTFLI